MTRVVKDLKKTVLLAVLTACACQEANRKISENQAVQIAGTKLEADFPRMDLNRMRRLASESGNAWLVTYSPDKEALGGPTTVVIDKRSGEVIVVLGSQ